MEKKEIFEKIKAALIEDFDLEEGRIVPDAKLYEDLELDSIDAVDLIVKLKSFLPKNIDPEAFKKMREKMLGQQKCIKNLTGRTASLREIIECAS